jgi:hypothetical protein
MKYLSIKNLAEHQHYKDRNPPWIKLHAKILANYEFGCLQDASKAHLMLLWVLASRLDNRIPYDLAWITKQIGATTPVDVEELVLQGFIEVSQDDGRTLAPRKQSATPETEGETEKRQRRKIAPDGAAKSKYPNFPVADSLRFHKTCVSNGYAPDMGLLRKTLAPFYPESGPVYTADEIDAGIVAFLEAKGGQPPDKARFWTILQFASDAARWVRLGAMPRSGPNGVTERGRLAVGIV